MNPHELRDFHARCVAELDEKIAALEKAAEAFRVVNELLAHGGCKRCAARRKESKDRMASLVERRLSAGLCSRCGQHAPDPGIKHCASCRATLASEYRAKRARVKNAVSPLTTPPK